MAARRLRPHDFARLLPLASNRSMAVIVQPKRAADWALMRLAEESIPTSRLSILTTKGGAELLQRITAAEVHAVLQEDDTMPLRRAAHWAIENKVHDIAVGDTRICNALTAVTRLDGGLRDAWMGGAVTGIEALPPGTVHVHKPFVEIDETFVDATTPETIWSLSDAPPREVDRASNLVNADAIGVQALLKHASRRAELARFARDECDIILRNAILEASHWGYIVVRRSALLDAFSEGRGGRHLTIHAMSRLVAHVSGAASMPCADDENVSRIIDELLQTDKYGLLRPLPKGRTVGGIVVRPATGRFAKRVLQMERRKVQVRTETGWRRLQTRRRDHPDDLMILTREPDHESGSLLSTRLRGIRACSPIDPNGTPVYWDNRHVLTAAPATHLDGSGDPFEARDIFAAVLKDKDTDEGVVDARLKDTELYVRQLRRTDWEKITAITNRVREFQIPYECIRALPAIFQKEPNSTSLGQLVASPHLGISARPDLYFTAIRMPRFRVLPTDIDPGFCESHFNELSDSPSPRRWRSSQRAGTNAAIRAAAPYAT